MAHDLPGEVVNSSFGCIISSNGGNGHDSIYRGHVDDASPSSRLHLVLLHHLSGCCLPCLQQTHVSQDLQHCMGSSGIVKFLASHVLSLLALTRIAEATMGKRLLQITNQVTYGMRTRLAMHICCYTMVLAG